MASIENNVTLIGHLGQKPEVRAMPNGTSVAGFTMATSHKYKDDAGQKQEKTTWHRVVMYGGLADVAGEYLDKGSRVAVQGRIDNRKYEKDGKDNYISEVVATEMKMLDSKTKEQGQEKPKSQTQSRSKEESQFDDIPF